jgi:DNA-directed RNA polymerase II subunit RPB2
LRNSLSTGNWGRTATGEIAKTGVSQVLKRDTTYFATLSHLRRVVAPIKASSKTQKPRLLHNTHYGMICPSETPEGQKIGIVKNLTLMAQVTQGLDEDSNDQLVENYISKMDFLPWDLDVEPKKILSLTKIMLNGNWIGFTN